MIERAGRLARAMPIVVVAALAGAWLLPAVDWLRVSSPDPAAADRMSTSLDQLPGEPLVLVGFDPDLGTYAEIRPTVRALLVDLLARGGRLAIVSLTSEGRALASAEIARMERGDVGGGRVVDLGFVAGAEAGLVDLTRDLPTVEDGAGALGREVEAEGIASFDTVVVVGGNDLGPRSWVEQVAPRIGDVPFLAVTPTVLLPEVQPYVGGGQLDAALTTPRDGAAYRERVDLGSLAHLAEPADPRSLPLFVGSLIAVVALAGALGSSGLTALRSSRTRDAG